MDDLLIALHARAREHAHRHAITLNLAMSYSVPVDPPSTANDPFAVTVALRDGACSEAWVRVQADCGYEGHARYLARLSMSRRPTAAERQAGVWPDPPGELLYEGASLDAAVTAATARYARLGGPPFMFDAENCLSVGHGQLAAWRPPGTCAP